MNKNNVILRPYKLLRIAGCHNSTSPTDPRILSATRTNVASLQIEGAPRVSWWVNLRSDRSTAVCEIGKDREDRVLVQTWRHILLHFVTHTHTPTSPEPTCGFDTWLCVYGRGPTATQSPVKGNLQERILQENGSHVGGDQLGFPTGSEMACGVLFLCRCNWL